MQKPNEIREHILAVEQTKKITSAMELISSTRMKQVMRHIEHNRRYFVYIRRSMKEILTSSKEISHPYLASHEPTHCTYVVFSGDKGFCGAHNHNVLNFALEKIRNHSGKYGLVTLGQTAENFFPAHGITPDIHLRGIVQDPTLERARNVADELTNLYSSKFTDEIRIIYTSFYGETKRLPVEARILPLLLPDYDDIRDAEKIDEIMYHPSAQVVFNKLVPQYVVGYIFGIMVAAYTSEHFARMTAMRSATSNAGDMIAELNTQYNLVRQSAITNELAEIADAAEILKEASGYEQQ